MEDGRWKRERESKDFHTSGLIIDLSVLHKGMHQAAPEEMVQLPQRSSAAYV